MGDAADNFFVPRTCTGLPTGSQERISCALRNDRFRNLAAYVLLGDPGAGKSTAFKREADESRGVYIKARDFATFDPNEECRNKTIFIDGLDEMRAGGGDGRTPLDHIRRHLDRLGHPRFRLSCREADWLGASDSESLKQVSPDGNVAALHLDPLTDDDVLEILRHKSTVSDPEGFIRQANAHRLGDLLRNPQTLSLLIEAVGDSEWPKSRKETFDMACQQLVRDQNPEHRQAKRDTDTSDEALLNAAGYLCAIQLLSGIAGYAMDDRAIDSQHVGTKALANPEKLPLVSALKTGLFRGDGEERRIAIHRSVAEFLAARFMAASVEGGGLPLGRVLAMITVQDGGVVPDLRGLSAWLSALCGTGRCELIERDPLGVVLYGDVRNFSVDDKRLILKALSVEAGKYPWFRSEDWAAEPFGALGTADMASVFAEILKSPSRDSGSQALLDCVLDAIRCGESMPLLAEWIDAIARDASYWLAVRLDAVQALTRVSPDANSRLRILAEDIRSGSVEDRDDQILGTVLGILYPRFISPDKVFEYLHPPKQQNLSGRYRTFWRHELPAQTADDDLPILLDQLAKREIVLAGSRYDSENRLVAELLARGLETYGEHITIERLYAWLGTGLDKYAQPLIEKNHIERITRWFGNHPETLKAVIEYGVSLCTQSETLSICLHKSSQRLYGAPPPANMENWYLDKARTEKRSDLARYFFNEAVGTLIRGDAQQAWTQQNLETLESWTRNNPAFEKWLEPFITSIVGGWRQEHAISGRERNAERQKRKSEWVSHFQKQIVEIRSGSAPPQVLHDLALAYDDLLIDVEGETPRERLDDFLDGDTSLIDAAYNGFRSVLDRKDLPTIAEIVSNEVKGKMHFIRRPCLVGMEEFYRTDPVGALRLDDSVLSRLVAFRLTYDVGDTPPWFDALVQGRPALVAEVLVVYALAVMRAGKRDVAGIYPLAANDAHAEVARIALPVLLEGFPLRARKEQLGSTLDPLLKGGLRHLDRKLLLSLARNKLGQSSIDAAQRVYWLGCGLLINPTAYESALARHIGKSGVRRRYLASFLHGHGMLNGPGMDLPESALSLLIELLAPECSPERALGAHSVTPAMNAAELVRSFINTLGGSPGEAATKELERLLKEPKIANWHDSLRGALHSQRIASRKASFHPLGAEAVSYTLADLQPASAADLTAITMDILRNIARKIRDGNTNDYRQYWSYGDDNKTLARPKPENDCRDALLSDLKERFAKLGIDAGKEGYYADDKRADIRVSFGGAGGFNVPMEIKKDHHPDLWTAMHKQLIAQYVRDPGTDGCGIYLVFWFGGKGMLPPVDGRKLRRAKELEAALRETLTADERHRIHICVIDCALP